MTEKCLSTLALAKHFGVGRTTVFDAIKRGEIPAMRVGKLYRVRLSEIPDYVTRRWSDGKWCALREDLPAGRMVYFLTGIPGYVKIGFTTDLGRRVQDLQPGSPIRLELVAYVPDGTPADEAAYHRKFHPHRVESEWFRICPEIQAEIDRLRPLLQHAGASA